MQVLYMQDASGRTGLWLGARCIWTSVSAMAGLMAVAADGRLTLPLTFQHSFLSQFHRSAFPTPHTGWHTELGLIPNTRAVNAVLSWQSEFQILRILLPPTSLSDRWIAVVRKLEASSKAMRGSVRTKETFALRYTTTARRSLSLLKLGAIFSR